MYVLACACVCVCVCVTEGGVTRKSYGEIQLQ